MTRLLALMILSCLGVLFNSCGHKPLVTKMQQPSSDWEVIELIRSVKFDDKLAEFGKCIKKTPKSSLQKCEAIVEGFAHSCGRGSAKHCVVEAEFYLIGAMNTNKDIHTKGKEILAKSCESGYAPVCVSLGEVEDNKIKHWQRACELGSFLGCGNLAHAYHTGTQGAKQNSDKAKMYATLHLQIADRDCKAGKKIACEWLEQAFSDVKPLLGLQH